MTVAPDTKETRAEQSLCVIYTALKMADADGTFEHLSAASRSLILDLFLSEPDQILARYAEENKYLQQASMKWRQQAERLAALALRFRAVDGKAPRHITNRWGTRMFETDADIDAIEAAVGIAVSTGAA